MPLDPAARLMGMWLMDRCSCRSTLFNQKAFSLFLAVPLPSPPVACILAALAVAGISGRVPASRPATCPLAPRPRPERCGVRVAARWGESIQVWV